MPEPRFTFKKVTRLFALISIIFVCIVAPFFSSLAQRRSKETPPKVTGITSRKTANGEVISLSSDSALKGTQTWQDPDGSFHLVLPGSGESAVNSSPNGVKVRRVGNSLEIEVQAKRGSNVTIESGLNGLDLVVNGAVDSNTNSNDSRVTPAKSSPIRREIAPATSTQSARGQKEPSRTRVAGAKRQLLLNQSSQPIMSLEKTGASTSSSSQPEVQAPVVNAPPPSAPVVANQSAAAPTPAPPDAATQETANATPDEGSTESTSFFSGWWVTLILIPLIAGFIYWRHREKSGWEEVEGETTPQEVERQVEPEPVYATIGDRRDEARRTGGRPGGRRGADPRSAKPSQADSLELSQRLVGARSTSNTMEPAALFGAYRVDQEVGKLILGQPHRMDVLASRGADDRRAMEASLLKALRSVDMDIDGRRKARQALEEYGFVARQSAAVLLANDPCERAAAARILGDIGLPSSLQFLLEALYDSETIVRTQAVESIGSLKLPSAIGALLDIARRYPDVSSSVLSHALNACSIESLDFFDSPSGQSGQMLTGRTDPFNSEIDHLEPSATFQNLPESSDDEVLVDTLAMLQSTDAEARSLAAQTLAIYRVQRSVVALKKVASTDPEPAVRAVAVASLGAIDHESVFSSVLVGLADEARDVRAAAARAVSRLSFDRADAYARVIEMSDAQELTDVACACIKTGMAAQALDRLASEDRRQAYEAYSLLSLLARANQYQPVLDVIERHADLNICMVAVQLLGSAGPASISSELKKLADRNGMPEQLRTALLEAVTSKDQMQPA